MKRRLFISYILIIAISALITGILAYYFINFNYTNIKTEKLNSNMELIKKVLEENPSEQQKVNLYKLVQDLASRTNSRVTLFDKMGTPIADSENNSIIFKNYSKSPEISGALRGYKDTYKLRSPEVGKYYIYMSTFPVELENDFVIVRLGEEFGDVRNLINRVILYLVSSLALATIVTIILAYATTMKMIDPIKKLTEASKRMAEGDFKTRVQVKTGDELEELTESFNRMAEDIDNMILEISNLEEKRSLFIQNISHELRTPLTSLRGFIETLKTKDLSVENRQKALDIMEYEVERLTDMINDLFNLSDIENIGIDRKPEWIDLRKLIDRVLSGLLPQIQKHDISIMKKYPKHLKKLSCNRHSIEQIFTNLIENAIKYNNEGGSVSIEIANENEGIMTTITDTGIGISKSEEKKLFDRFYRGDRARHFNRKGTGLGLSIVNSIIEYYGGNIYIRSDEDIGTQVKVFLPYNK